MENGNWFMLVVLVLGGAASVIWLLATTLLSPLKQKLLAYDSGTFIAMSFGICCAALLFWTVIGEIILIAVIASVYAKRRQGRRQLIYDFQLEHPVATDITISNEPTPYEPLVPYEHYSKHDIYGDNFVTIEPIFNETTKQWMNMARYADNTVRYFPIKNQTSLRS